MKDKKGPIMGVSDKALVKTKEVRAITTRYAELAIAVSILDDVYNQTIIACEWCYIPTIKWGGNGCTRSIL